MKKLRILVWALVLCMVLGAGAMAEGAVGPILTAELIGTWVAEVPEFGRVSMAFGNDGLGEMSMNGEPLGSFAMMAQGDFIATYAMEEDGLMLEEGTLAFVDENTITVSEAEGVMTLTRVEAPESRALALNNAFIGKWEADIPSAGAVLGFEFLTDGSYSVSMDGVVLGSWAYMVYEDAMATIEGEDGVCEYRFVVADENTLKVTEDGVTVDFVRAVE